MGEKTDSTPEGVLSTNLNVVSDSSSDTSDKSGSGGFSPGWRFYVAFSSLMVITLMAALDATALSVALPVSGQTGSLSNK